MKITAKICVFLLLSALLAGCGETVAPTETTAQTQPTETAEVIETTAATQPPEPITTQAALEAALAENLRVVLEGDIRLTTGVVVKDHYLVGNGYKITAPAYDEADPETYCGIFLSKGTLENITVWGGYRAIGTGADHRATGDLRLTNVIAEGENCALYVGHGDLKGSVYVVDSEFYGQTVYNKVTHASFENCTFGFNDSGSRGNITAYADTTLIGCRFKDMEGKKYTISFSSKVDGMTMVLEDCYYGDTLITQENITNLLKVKPNSNTIAVRNTIG